MIKNNFRILKKTHANFQTIAKAPVKFQKDWPKSVGGVEGTRYLLKIRNHAPRITHYALRTTHYALRKAENNVPPLFFEKAGDNDIVAGTLKVVILPIKKPQRKMYLYQKGDYESKRKDTFVLAKEKYFNGYPDTRSVQENFNFITSFIQDSADKHISFKTSRTVSSVPWITSEIRRKIRRRNKTHAKAKRRAVRNSGQNLKL